MVGIANNRRTIYTKNSIREAFLTLLEQKELDKITVKEITELADINRGTFYKYYKDSFDLLERIKPEAFQHFSQYFPEASTAEKELYLSYFVEGSVGLIVRWLKDYETMSAAHISKLLLNVFKTEIY